MRKINKRKQKLTWNKHKQKPKQTTKTFLID